MVEKEKNIPINDGDIVEETENKKKAATDVEMEEEKKTTRSSKKKISKDKLKELEDKYDELNDRYLRLYSEFDNYRKRTIKEKIELSKVASENLVVDLLPVLDDFDRAIKASEETDNVEALREGIKLIYIKLFKLLSLKGLEPIEAIGKNFDTDVHEAITKFPAPTYDLRGKVINETEKGYTLNGKVIRYSKVVVGE